MKCNKCGNEINEDELECSNCGMSIEENKKADKLTGISAILLFVLPEIIGYILSRLIDFENNFGHIPLIGNGLCALIGLTLLIYVRIKFPKHEGSKILLISYLFLAIISILVLALFVGMCVYCFENMPD